MNLSERINKALNAKPHLSKAGLARACGVKAPSVTDWVNGRTKALEGSNLLHASDYLGVRPRWLAEGIGPMTDSGNTVQEPMASYQVTPAWPFKSIKPNEWAQLDASAKKLIEQMIRGQLTLVAAEQTKAA